MKLAIVLLACLLAVAYADDHDHHDHHEHHDQHEHHEHVDVIKQYADVDTEDFKYGLELSNHIKADQEGHLEDKHNWNVKGAYEYVTKDGKHVHVSYHADEHGYHPVVDY